MCNNFLGKRFCVELLLLNSEIRSYERRACACTLHYIYIIVSLFNYVLIVVDAHGIRIYVYDIRI